MPCRNSPASMSACTRPMVSALQAGAGSHFFQEEARDVRPRALRLPSLAQNILMEFTRGAMAGGLAALARALRQSATKKPAAGNQLRYTGTDAAFGGGDGGAGKGIAHCLNNNNIQEWR